MECVNKIYSITAIQCEYSLWTREIEKVILSKVPEPETGIVPYNALGRGFLTGAIIDVKPLSDNDWCKLNLRFSQEATEKNLLVIKILEEIAEKKTESSACMNSCSEKRYYSYSRYQTNKKFGK